jgi:hypothetical protein
VTAPLKTRRTRTIARAGVVSFPAVSVLVASALASAPAFAAKETGVQPGKGIGLGLALLLFIGVPLAVFFFIAALVYGPSMLRRPRYRPGYQEWGYRPLWIGGPTDPDAALTRVAPGAIQHVGGGAGASW